MLFGRDVIHGHRTVFPIPLGLAASLDEDLVEEVRRAGRRRGRRRRRRLDLRADGRHLRGAALGSGRRVARRDAGAQPAAGRGDGARLPGRRPGAGDRIAACAKHFAGYGLSAGGRDYDTVSVGENTLRNLHLRPFHAAVDGGVCTVMAAFNDVDGIPMHAHRHLLRDVLKGEWGFDGVVVADWNGIGQLVLQGVAADLRDAARQAIEAGVDLDMCSGSYAAHLADLVASGEVDVALVDDAVRRVLRLKFRLRAVRDRPYAPGATRRRQRPDRAVPRTLAREAAARRPWCCSKNNGVLPLARRASGPCTWPARSPRRARRCSAPGSSTGGARTSCPRPTAFRERGSATGLLVSDGRFSDRRASAGPRQPT